MLGAFAFPGAAFGQATRTWTSGVGDDANPCSRTAPCKTFAGAISKTADRGEINALDPGGFGGITITKSITIKSTQEAGVLVAGTNAIVINAPADAKVTLKGLDINGLERNSLSGVKVLSARSVHLIDDEIYGFADGVTVAPVSPRTRVYISRSHIHDNGVGVINAPGNYSIHSTAVRLRHDEVVDNVCGAAVSSYGTNASTPVASNGCGTAGPGSGEFAVNKPALMTATHSVFDDNDVGVFTRGPRALFTFANSEVVGNAIGLRRVDGSTIETTKPRTNLVHGNDQSDRPNAFTQLW